VVVQSLAAEGCDRFPGATPSRSPDTLGPSIGSQGHELWPPRTARALERRRQIARDARETRDARPPPPRALAAVRDNAPEVRLVRELLDNWSGLGLIVAGMTNQGGTCS
jgi:hypothetical protein